MSGLGLLSFQFCQSQMERAGFLRQIVFICCLSSAAESARIELADSVVIGWVVSRLVVTGYPFILACFFIVAYGSTSLSTA
jgi:hypothetical protein